MFGERNGSAKLSNKDVDLLRGVFDSYKADISRIDKEIEALKSARREVKKKMRRKVLAEAFDISESHCKAIIQGSSRGRYA